MKHLRVFWVVLFLGLFVSTTQATYLNYNFLFSFITGAFDPKNLPEELRKVLETELGQKLLATLLREKSFNDPAIVAATTEFGQVVIDLNQFKEGKLQTPRYSLKTIPWSGWWFPDKEDSLYRQDLKNPKDLSKIGALRKYDMVRQYLALKAGTALPESAAEFEKTSAASAVSLDWYGKCDALAIAAALMPEPKEEITFNLGKKITVTFTPGDLKALQVLTFDGVGEDQLKIYGQRNFANSKGYLVPDILPEQMYRLLDKQIRENQKPLVFERDPGIESWNYPVIGYYNSMRFLPASKEVGRPDNRIQVQTKLFYANSTDNADPVGEYDFVGTKTQAKEYNYMLYGDLDPKTNLFTVTSSAYLESQLYPDGKSKSADSVKDHPDYFMIPKETLLENRKSRNPNVDIDLVDRIIKGQLE